ncbi:TRAP transporter small permease subunit [Pelagibius marinus]|uniref:TRAP transporter small permease subunit n=1 Tax=Pelagibius marinus TaxID=2762760 RepID=UPI0018722FB7|nr:TRAP transporter small permease subunit [Pelagibius marinus]
MQTLSAAIDILESINDRIGKAVAWLNVLLVVNVFTVVVMRYVFSLGWVWMQELYVWTHATIFLAGAGYTLLHNGHVRIDLIYGIARPRYKAAVDLVGTLCLGLPLVGVILDRSWPMIHRSWLSLEKSAEIGGLPGLFLLKSMIAAFCCIFGLQLLAMLLRALRTLVTGEAAAEQIDMGAEVAREALQ